MTQGQDSAGRPRLVVGIGASAGGLQALEQFFEAMPADRGISFVVVQHLSPDFKSVLVDLLSRHTGMDVISATDDTLVAPNTVYLLPPSKDIEIVDGRLRLADRPEHEPVNLLIDRFFRSLAVDQGPRAAVVVLSGTGSDGSRSLEDVDAHEGLIIVQDPETANFDGMPQSAIGTGFVDIVCSPSRMPAALVDHAEESLLTGNATRRAQYDSGVRTAYPIVFDALNATFGIDFGFYKPGTITRRVERRMQMLEIEDVAAYAQRLEQDPAELDALYHDLLIGVTHFFRDPDAFHALETRVLPNLIRESPEIDIRVWVCGCATGEEAYTLAILINEILERTGTRKKVKIFATDVHGGSLEIASNGVYPLSALASVPEHYVDKYFVEQHDGMRVVSSIRQQIVFSSHNVLSDPPFTRIDLVSCRNLLIYFEQQAQKMALSMLQFALRMHGILFLGSSETLGNKESAFEVLDAKWRIWSKIQEQTKTGEGPRFHVGGAPAARNTPTRAPMERPAAGGRDHSLLRAYDAVLEKVMPPSLLVDSNRTLVHAFGDAGRYFGLVSGRPTYDLLQLVHDDLRVALSMGLQKAEERKGRVVFEAVEVKVAGEVERVDVEIDPIDRLREGTPLYLVTFRATDWSHDDGNTETVSPLSIDDRVRDRMAFLEHELDETRSNLNAMVEELETSNEELQATNEEMMASNEELQSTNEELHSVNEELYTVNAEYEQKNTELQRLASDMDNLLRSTDIGTVFVDRELKIREFTPAIGRTLRLLPQDIGRPIDHIASTLEGENDLVGELQDVIRSGGKLEREVQTRDGSWLLQRILPYLDNDRRVDGAILTYVDIDRLKRFDLLSLQHVTLHSEREEIEHRLEAVLSSSGNMSFVLDPATGAFDWVGSPVLGLDELSMPRSLDELLARAHPDDREKVESKARDLDHGASRYELEARFRDRDDHWVWLQFRGIVRKGETSTHILGVVEDVGERRAAIEALARSELRFRTTFERANVGIAHATPDGTLLLVNEHFAHVLGRTREELAETRLREITHPDDLDADAALIQRALDGEIDDYSIEKRFLRKDGRPVTAHLTASLVRDERKRPAFFILVIDESGAGN